MTDYRNRRREPNSHAPAEQNLAAQEPRHGAASAIARLPRRVAHGLIRGYQLSLSMLVGRQCRHWPSCSAYTDEAIQRHGLWRGGWVGFARICRCNPYGTSGIDLVCEELPPDARWYRPWSYGRWRGTNVPAAFDSDAQPAAGGGTHPHP